ncbi:MAG: hypothetical protein K0S71_2948 [Clostridia bacterium]|jgi:hypothetical protein|nr:hypothetical protein [Clostridia bacterium]
MKLIVEYDEQKNVNLGQYCSRVEQLGRGYAALEIHKRYLKWLSGITKDFEENSSIGLKDLDEPLDPFLFEQDSIILAIIGHKQLNSSVTHFYNMNTKVIRPTSGYFQNDMKRRCISCFNESDIVDAICLIKCIRVLTNISKKLNKPLIIYASVDMPSDNYMPESLFFRIANQYIQAATSLLILKPPRKNQSTHDILLENIHRNPSNRIIEDNKGINESIRKALLLLMNLPDTLNTYSHEKKDSISEINDTRQAGGLFNDPLYLSIDPNEEIYMPLLAEAAANPSYYEELGFHYISLETGLRMLYGRKSEFDKHSEHIRVFVIADYRLNILTHAPCMRDNDKPTLPYFLPPESQKYTGKGVYIGIITTDDIDYTNMALRRQDGSTRIAYIWEQKRSNEGNFYTSEQIDAALASPNPSAFIRLPTEESMSTVMTAISGGWNEETGYRGIAPEAEFLIAKIRPVSDNLQRIYGGMPNPKAIILHDAMIGILELARFALNKARPLVLIMPFNGNIDSHDAALLIQQQLSILARRIGLTVIVPTGDETNKRHHFDILGEQEGRRSILLEVEQPNQNVVGVIYQWGANMRTAELYPPSGAPISSVNLKQPVMMQLGSTTIYSSGEYISFWNGTFRTLFRIENPSVGEWRIESVVHMGTANRIEMWISQEELNHHIKLNPNATLLTMGSTSCIPNIMSVGAYDFNSHTVISSSGRGDLQSAFVVPTLVTYGKSIIAPCTSGEWVGVTGTVPAASFMAGAVAALYQKHIETGNARLPNTIVMNSIITRSLTQFDALQYPNPSQGYGVFSLETLTQILDRAIK